MAAVIWLVPAIAMAGWSTNIWPAYTFPRKASLWEVECYSGIVERYQAVGIDTSTVTAPVWYRLERSELALYKDRITNLLSARWWDSELVATGAVFTWLTTDITNGLSWYTGTYYTIVYAQMPQLTVMGLCSNANLPTNFFDYTPYRCLSGLGPFTNDGSVGHLHGYENEYTEVGGTNTLPAGRSKWYTTDYGWDGLKAAISEITTTYDRFKNLSGVGLYGEISITASGIVWSGDRQWFESTNQWEDSKAIAATNSGALSGAYAAGTMTSGQGSYGPDYSKENFEAYGGRMSFSCVVGAYATSSTPRQSEAYSYVGPSCGTNTYLPPYDYYVIGRPFPDFWGSSTSEWECADYDLGWNAVGSSALSTTRLSFVIGDTATSPVPDWCVSPFHSAPWIRYSFRGYGINDTLAVSDWDFEFK